MIDEKQRFINRLEEALQNIKHTRLCPSIKNGMLIT
jgi:hypothetical protein